MADSDIPAEPLRVGDMLHGYCGGAFGRDHYQCSRVEAIGPDWVVVRTPAGWALCASGPTIVTDLREYRRPDGGPDCDHE